jgi:pyridoxamine 5'-phosphate oxidase
MSNDESFRAKRKEYRSGQLVEDVVDPDPFRQFRGWFDAVMTSEVEEPNACALATCSLDAIPSVRMVLLKGIDSRGMIFFTNYGSAKAEQIELNPRAAMVFYWAQFERQVRIEGSVERLEALASDTYFASRPRDAQVGASVSRQSKFVASRAVIEESVARFTAEHSDRPLQRPIYWGGYRVVPSVFEFWQGRENRLHDRLRYIKAGDGWTLQRLWP